MISGQWDKVRFQTNAHSSLYALHHHTLAKSMAETSHVCYRKRHMKCDSVKDKNKQMLPTPNIYKKKYCMRIHRVQIQFERYLSVCYHNSWNLFEFCRNLIETIKGPNLCEIQYILTRMHNWTAEWWKYGHWCEEVLLLLHLSVWDQRTVTKPLQAIQTLV